MIYLVYIWAVIILLLGVILHQALLLLLGMFAMFVIIVHIIYEELQDRREP